MALKVELRPNERILIGDCLITNIHQRTRLLISGSTPILREKHIMTVEQADTPAKRIYLAVQLMYIARDARPHHDVYFALIRDIVRAAPSTWSHIEIINNHILSGELYKALKQSHKLIEYEQELVRNATRSAGLSKGSKRNS